MNEEHTLVRTLHDVGAAVWLGGSLMGAVGLNGASKDVTDPDDRTRTAARGWARWAPVSAAAIGAHLLGGLGLLIANRGRVLSQSGVTANTAVKTALTLAAIGTTAYSGVLGVRLARAGKVPAEGGTVPSDATPHDVAVTLQQLRALQWVTPALTTAIVALGAQQGEQQRPSRMLAGVGAKLVHAAGR
ncbi:hypothetical protein [Dactylosporangium sp. NPDC051484]|uniref:hypothetical protein n=1 Tax=Dactylosporangium sp. NPDC051484 TaxID=3154942 RepID=UPI00344F3514